MWSPGEVRTGLASLALLFLLQAVTFSTCQQNRSLMPPSVALGLGSAAGPGPTQGLGSVPGPVAALLTERVKRNMDSGKIQINDPMCGLKPRRKRQTGTAEGDVLSVEHELFIVGGVTAEVGQFPWLVGVANFFSTAPFCGGAIINERFVVTAAHCLISDTQTVFSRSAITLAVLVNKHLRKDDERQIKFSIEKIIRHPDYNRRTVNDDLALLKLKDGEGRLHDLLVSGIVRPICLPEEPCEGTGRPACLLDRDVIIAGWGSLAEDGAKPTALQVATVKVLPNEVCRDAYRNAFRGITLTVNDGMLCAGQPDGGTDTCDGDSGGPMMLEINGKITLVGVVSFGKFCASPDYPGVYARVSEYTEWIINNSRV
ncbi:Venom protease [Amphibalanus amphitrite]|uniref:limulus clotting factor C n=1 Tax=Amphibalanus amphitrite TaxID=1232801 RepID=A0A6A4VM67_AMPAM|nr:Venom protease [Amphibalanus amphitrite]